MARASAALAISANPSPEVEFRRLGSTLPLNAAVAKAAKRRWPSKTDVQMAVRTGTSDRACREVIAGRSTLSAESLAGLLRSEDGFEFLVAVMADAEPAWWRWCLRIMAIAGLRRRQREDRDLLSRLENDDGPRRRAARNLRNARREDAELADAIAAAETAAALQDQEFYHDHFEALRGAAYPPVQPDRAMASQAKGRGRR